MPIHRYISYLILLLLLPFAIGMSSNIQPEDTVAQSSYEKASRSLKILLQKEAGNFIRLPDGTIIDRTTERLYLQTFEIASSQMHTEGMMFVYPQTKENIAWGIARADNTVAEQPSFWHTLDGEPFETALWLDSNSPTARQCDILQALENQSAICDIHWRPLTRTDARSTPAYISEIPGTIIDGGHIPGPAYLLKSTPDTHTYTTVAGAIRTVKSYQYFDPSNSVLSAEELFDLLKQDKVTLYKWTPIRKSETRNGKKISVYTWKRTPFEPRAIRQIKSD